MKKAALVFLLLFVGVAHGVEFDANNDNVFDDTYKFDVDNLYDSGAQISANSRTLLKSANFAAWRTNLLLGDYAYQADCSTIDSGVCIDSDNGIVYYWDGDSVEAVGSSVQLGDIVATSPMLINGGAALNDVLPGADGDVTISIPAATTTTPGHMPAADKSKIDVGLPDCTAGSGDCGVESVPNTLPVDLWPAPADGAAGFRADSDRKWYRYDPITAEWTLIGSTDVSLLSAQVADLGIRVTALESALAAMPPFPALSVSPTSYDFGNVLENGTSASQNFIVTSVGTDTATTGALSVSGTGAAMFIIGTEDCNSTTLDPEVTCTIALTYEPTEAAAHTATLNIPSDAADSPKTVALSGTGVASGGPQSQTRVPTATGFAEGWTGTSGAPWENLDDTVGACDDNATIAYKQNSGGVAYFEYTDFAITSSSVDNVTVNFRCLETIADSSVRAILRIGGTNYLGSDKALTTSFADLTGVWSTNPRHNAACVGSADPDACCTGAGTGTCAWTEEEVEGGGTYPLQQWALEARGMTTGEEVQCTCSSITVNYQE